MSLRRVLLTRDVAWMVVGNMVGAGIFITPGLVAGHLPGAAWILAVWIVGGLLALSGAAVYGELGSRVPEAGGDYRFLHVAFGPVPAFLSGWSAFALTFSAAAAAMVLSVVDRLRHAWPVLVDWDPSGGRILGVTLLLALTAANAAGLRQAGRVTVWLTALALAGLVGLAVVGLLLADSPWMGRPRWWTPPVGSWPVAVGAALVPIYFTYSGWNAAAYVAGEIKDASRALPRGLGIGTAAVMSLYVGVNLLLVLVLPAGDLAGSTTAMEDATHVLLGTGAERVLAAVIALAILGSANVTLMAGARIYYAMGRDGIIPASMGRVNAAGVPGTSLWISGIWSALLVLWGRFHVLVGWATLAILLISSLTVVGLYVLRSRGDEPPAFRCPGYPLTPALYLTVSLGVALAGAVSEPVAALIGVAIVLAGIPMYYLLSRRSGQTGG
ncbi:MAG: APC family permease [Acidobacteriota bacterium]